MANEGSVYSQHPFRRLALAVILQAKKDIDSAPDYIANDARAFVNTALFYNLCALGNVNRDVKKQMLSQNLNKKKEVEPTRYKLAGKEAEIKERLKNETITSLAVNLGVSRTTLFYFIKKNNLK
jgi:hypothetical protein